MAGNTTADVSFILYDNNFNEIFNGVTTCGGPRAGLFNINNTLGKILGYITDNSVSDYIITSSLNNTGTNSPDLRRVRNVNIMLVDFIRMIQLMK